MTSSVSDSPILFRVDASGRIGMGHLMRCLALAQIARRRNVSSRFCIRPLDGSGARLLEQFGQKVAFLEDSMDENIDAMATMQHARSANSKFIVVDHYDLGETWRNPICDAGFRLLAFDDIAAQSRITTHLLLNQNLGASSLATRYTDIAPNAIHLLGETYALLRDDLFSLGQELRPQRIARWNELRQRAQPPNLTVVMGGSDPLGLTPIVLNRLVNSSARWEAIQVALGPGACEQLETRIRTLARNHREVAIHRSPDFPALLRNTDVAITAGGTTTHELAYLGIPMVLVRIAENQLALCEGFRRAELAEVLTLEDLPTQRLDEAVAQLANYDNGKRLASRLMETIDGKGGERVLDRLCVG